MADVPAANISIKIKTSQGRRKLRIAEITADGSGTTIPASSLDMTYIDWAIMSPQKAALCDTADYNYLTVSGASTIITMAATGSSAATMDLMAWGW